MFTESETLCGISLSSQPIVRVIDWEMFDAFMRRRLRDKVG